ncbi:hypothetical protein CGC21_33515 [Leishmania donovani]|uniref:Uncharacterized protein n=1 Tax=Leishmania donovani TaxID=5661 RepID=A0A504X853_LEIDO|nr:hypothetical protein CGC21_33515 [Leishmania donovani]
MQYIRSWCKHTSGSVYLSGDGSMSSSREAVAALLRAGYAVAERLCVTGAWAVLLALQTRHPRGDLGFLVRRHSVGNAHHAQHAVPPLGKHIAPVAERAFWHAADILHRLSNFMAGTIPGQTRF